MLHATFLRIAVQGVRSARSMLAWSLSRLAMVAVIVSIACCGFSSRPFAQQQESLVTSFVPLGFALQAPDFDSSDAVEHHEIFSVLLANLLVDTFARNPAEPCTVSAGVNFPDLRIGIYLKEQPKFDLNELGIRTTLAGCVRAIETILTTTTFERGAFDAAIQQAYARDVVWKVKDYSDLNNPGDSHYRMQIVGRAAIAELYRSDIVVTALVDLHGKIEAAKGDHSGFSAWLDRQRQSQRMGFYPANRWSADAVRALVPLQSTPSIRPVPRPDKPLRDEIRIDVPVNVRGRPFILVWCAIGSSQACEGGFVREACGKGIETLPSSRPEVGDSRLSALCWQINLLGIGTWIYMESNDETELRKLRDYLATRRAQKSSDAADSNEELAAWVDTKY